MRKLAILSLLLLLQGCLAILPDGGPKRPETEEESLSTLNVYQDNRIVIRRKDDKGRFGIDDRPMYWSVNPSLILGFKMRDYVYNTKDLAKIQYSSKDRYERFMLADFKDGRQIKIFIADEKELKYNPHFLVCDEEKRCRPDWGNNQKMMAMGYRAKGSTGVGGFNLREEYTDLNAMPGSTYSFGAAPDMLLYNAHSDVEFEFYNDAETSDFFNNLQAGEVARQEEGRRWREQQQAEQERAAREQQERNERIKIRNERVYQEELPHMAIEGTQLCLRTKNSSVKGYSKGRLRNGNVLIYITGIDRGPLEVVFDGAVISKGIEISVSGFGWARCERNFYFD